MTASPRILTSGPSAIRAANALKKAQAVPFPWDLPPHNSKPVCQSQSIVAPAAATQTLVVEYTVPAGMQFVLTDRVNNFEGSPFVPGSSDILWTTDVDDSIGVTEAQGWPVEGMVNEAFPVGSFASPWPVRGYLVFSPLNVVRVKVTTTAAITAGAPNYFTSILMGWIWPER